MTGFPPRTLLLFAPALLAGLARGAEPPAAPEALEARMLPGARLVLSKGKVLLAAARIRTAETGPVLAADADWQAAKPLAKGSRTPQQLDFASADPARLVSLLLQVRRVPAGARILVSPELADAGSRPRTTGAADLELAIELFPAPGAREPLWPELSAVDISGTVAARTWQGKLPEPGGPAFRATRLSFDVPGRPRVELARSGPAQWQFTRGQKSLLLRQKLLPDPREPLKPGTFEFFLGDERDGVEAELSPLRLDRAQVPAWDMVEGSLRIYAGGADPYGYDELLVFAEIACPDDSPPAANGEELPPKVVRIPCFYREGPARAPAEGEFRFRFAPPGPGTYAARITALSPGGLVRGEAVPFRAGPPASRGFIRTREGERAFRHDDGSVVYPVGLNLGWPAAPNDAGNMRERFRELARHGGNAARIWISSWGLPLEGPRAGQFSNETAEALDEIFHAAQARGIGLILAAENAHDLAANSARHPYFKETGGPLPAPAEFFRNAAAIKLYKRRLTYLCARYGAFRSLWAWELLNEADEAWPALKTEPDDARVPVLEADTARAARRDVLAWTTLFSQHLKAMDGAEHPVMLSVALPPEHPWLGLHQHAELAAVQEHAYIPEAADARDDLQFDEAGLLAAWVAAAREPGRPHKPFFLGEFGYRALHDLERQQAGPAAEAADRNTRDAGGLLLHNASFAALACGMAATPMNWWWDRHVEKHGLWHGFKGPSIFAAALGELATREGPNNLRDLNNDAEAARGAGVRVLGRVGRTGLCVWIQDRRSTWARLLEKNEAAPPEIKNLEVRLPALAPGKYTVRWLDTWKGEVTGTEALEVKPDGGGQALELKCPAFKRDLAILVEPVKQAP